MILMSILKSGSLEKEAPSNASNWPLNTSRKMLVARIFQELFLSLDIFLVRRSSKRAAVIGHYVV
jgi:hypothetical protein